MDYLKLVNKNPIKILYNYIIVSISMLCPFPNIKNFILRTTGLKIGKNVFIAVNVNIDPFFPELIEIGDNTVIGYGCVITAHELLPNEFRTGKIKIGKNVLIGTRSVILPNVTIKDNSKVSAMSLVNKNVDGFYGGVPAKKINSNRNSDC